MAIFTALYLDSRLRRGSQRFAHAGFALLFVIAFTRLIPFVTWQVLEFDKMIYSEEQEK
jgi:hypothetical protein